MKNLTHTDVKHAIKDIDVCSFKCLHGYNIVKNPSCGFRCLVSTEATFQFMFVNTCGGSVFHSSVIRLFFFLQLVGLVWWC